MPQPFRPGLEATVEECLNSAFTGLSRCCVSCVIRRTEQRHVEFEFVCVFGNDAKSCLNISVLKNERNRILLSPGLRAFLHQLEEITPFSGVQGGHDAFKLNGVKRSDVGLNVSNAQVKQPSEEGNP